MEENQKVVKEKKNYGLGIASFVFGVLSVVTMCYIIVSVICGALAIVLGIISCIIEKKGFGIAGLVIGIASVVVTVFLYIVLGVMELDLLMIPDWYKF